MGEVKTTERERLPLISKKVSIGRKKAFELKLIFVISRINRGKPVSTQLSPSLYRHRSKMLVIGQGSSQC